MNDFEKAKQRSGKGTIFKSWDDQDRLLDDYKKHYGSIGDRSEEDVDFRQGSCLGLSTQWLIELYRRHNPWDGMQEIGGTGASETTSLLSNYNRFLDDAVKVHCEFDQDYDEREGYQQETILDRLNKYVVRETNSRYMPELRIMYDWPDSDKEAAESIIDKMKYDSYILLDVAFEDGAHTMAVKYGTYFNTKIRFFDPDGGDIEFSGLGSTTKSFKKWLCEYLRVAYKASDMESYKLTIFKA